MGGVARPRCGLPEGRVGTASRKNHLPPPPRLPPAKPCTGVRTGDHPGMQPWQLPDALNRAGTAAGEGWAGGRARRRVSALRLTTQPGPRTEPGPDTWHRARPPAVLIPGSRSSCYKSCCVCAHSRPGPGQLLGSGSAQWGRCPGVPGQTAPLCALWTEGTFSPRGCTQTTLCPGVWAALLRPWDPTVRWRSCVVPAGLTWLHVAVCGLPRLCGLRLGCP